MIKQINTVGLFLLLFWGYSFAQPQILQQLRKHSPEESFVIKSWNSNNGLPQNSINRIAQDKNGIIWLATYGGLVRFDGANFKTYSVKNYPELISDRIVSLFLDSKNRIWLCTENGKIIIFDGRRFTDFSSKYDYNFLLTKHFNEDSEGNIYIKSDSSLFYYSKGILQPVKLYDSNGKLFSSVLYSTSNLFNDTLFLSSATSYFLVHNGKWIKSVAKGVGIVNLSIPIFTPAGIWFQKDSKNYFSKTFDGISSAKPVLEDVSILSFGYFNNNIYAITSNKGVIKINSDFSYQTLFNLKNVTLSIWTNFFVDREDNYLIGTQLDGLIFAKRKFVYTLDKSYGLQKTNTYAIYRSSDNDIWIGQNPGLNKISNGKLTTWGNDMVFNPYVWGLTEDKHKNIWVSTNANGLFKIDVKENIENLSLKNSELGSIFFSAYKDKKDRLWFGTIEKIFRFEDDKITKYSPLNVRNNIYRNIIEDDKGIMWFASDFGLVKLENEIFTLLDSINAKFARSLYIDKKSRLWIGTYGNGIRIKVKDKYVKLTSRDGLYSDIISAIVEDNKGYFWFTTNTGLFRINEEDINRFVDGTAKSVTSISFGIDEGLANIEFNGGCQPSWMRDDEGNLWFPSFGGPVIVDIKSLKTSSISPKVFIDDLTINDTIYYPDDKIILPHNYTQFSINFYSSSFSSPNNVRFKYRLIGYKDEWVDIGTRRRIDFQKLPYGDYEYQVISSDIFGNWAATPAKIKFSVKAVFWETPYFYTIASLLVILSIFLFFIARLKTAKNNQAKLERIVSERTESLKIAKEVAEQSASEEKLLRSKSEEENRQKIELLRIVSHDLKNPVFAVQGFSELLLEDGNLNEDDRQSVEMIQDASERLKELITQLLNFSRFEGGQFIVDKSKVNVVDEVKKIVSRYQRNANKKEQTIKTEYNADNILLFVDATLLSQIIENLISNSIKYSKNGKSIFVSVGETNSEVQIKIKDEGEGFNQEDLKNLYKPFVKLSSLPTAGESSSGLGLTIVKRFVELNNGDISLESEKGKGSLFTITFKKYV
jgi:signal transduction histidine kinase/ligand-binding sensor domain-containing protein